MLKLVHVAKLRRLVGALDHHRGVVGCVLSAARRQWRAFDTGRGDQEVMAKVIAKNRDQLDRLYRLITNMRPRRRLP